MIFFNNCKLKINYRETPYDKALIQRYRKALDTAVKIATVYNVQPIKGKTIVLCDIGENMDVNCTAAKGLGKPRKVSFYKYSLCSHAYIYC